MKGSFRSPNEFLEYIRSVYVRPMSIIQGAPNVDFQRITNERMRNVTPPQNPYEEIVGRLWDEIQHTLSPEFKAIARDRIAVGSLDNISVNATCVRSDEGFVAIVMNRGLMALFNKLSKLQIASAKVNSVEYCNRGPATHITPVIAMQWLMETCEHYSVTGKPLGPQIRLAPSVVSHHSYQLHAWEVFVLAHEVGHVVSGHLDDIALCTDSREFGMLMAYNENKSHVRETEADIFAYHTLRRSQLGIAGELSTPPNFVDDQSLLAVVVLLFNILFLIGARQSNSHPDPIDRLCSIAANVYGAETADLLAKTYGNKGLLKHLFGSPLIPKYTNE